MATIPDAGARRNADTLTIEPSPFDAAAYLVRDDGIWIGSIDVAQLAPLLFPA